MLAWVRKRGTDGPGERGSFDRRVGWEGTLSGPRVAPHNLFPSRKKYLRMYDSR